MANDDQLLEAVRAGDLARVRGLAAAGAEINARCDQGASVLFYACLSGDVELVRLLLDLGAAPNLTAEGPAATMYAANPLCLVMQARAVMDWGKYTPVYDLLVERGATDRDGARPKPEMTATRLLNCMDAYLEAARRGRKRRWWQFWK